MMHSFRLLHCVPVLGDLVRVVSFVACVRVCACVRAHVLCVRACVRVCVRVCMGMFCACMRAHVSCVRVHACSWLVSCMYEQEKQFSRSGIDSPNRPGAG